MLLGFNDSKCTAYTVDSARGLIVIRTHLVLASGKLVLQKKVGWSTELGNLLKGHGTSSFCQNQSSSPPQRLLPHNLRSQALFYTFVRSAQ